jgi:hypothetical protein
VGIPPMPDASVHRNMFRGPRYFGLDATLSKSFRFPKMPVFGENARVVFQSYFYNVFNKLNLKDVNTTISNDGVNSNPLFGTAQGALAGRIVEFQVKFSF